MFFDLAGTGLLHCARTLWFLQRVALWRSLSVCCCGGAWRRRPTTDTRSGWAHFLRGVFLVWIKASRFDWFQVDGSSSSFHHDAGDGEKPSQPIPPSFRFTRKGGLAAGAESRREIASALGIRTRSLTQLQPAECRPKPAEIDRFFAYFVSVLCLANPPRCISMITLLYITESLRPFWKLLSEPRTRNSHRKWDILSSIWWTQLIIVAVKGNRQCILTE